MTHINKIITKYPIYDTVQIITDSEISSITTTTSQFRSNDLYNILTNAQPKPRYLEAYPFNSNPEISDKLMYDNGIVTLLLTKDSFTRIPNLKSKYGSNKIKQSKVFDGVNDRTKIKLIELELELIPVLKFIIDKLFNDVEIIAYYNELVDEAIGIFSIEKNSTKLPNNLLNVNLDNDEFYELITLCCNFENIIHDNDAFTSITIESELEIRNRYTLKNVSSQNLTNLDWEILSLHNEKHHILLYKSDPKNIIVYEVDRK